MENITFTVTKVTSNFGGLFNVKTKHLAGRAYNREGANDIGVMELYTVLSEITEDLNADGYGVTFEMG